MSIFLWFLPESFVVFHSFVRDRCVQERNDWTRFHVCNEWMNEWMVDNSGVLAINCRQRSKAIKQHQQHAHLVFIYLDAMCSCPCIMTLIFTSSEITIAIAHFMQNHSISFSLAIKWRWWWRRRRRWWRWWCCAVTVACQEPRHQFIVHRFFFLSICTPSNCKWPK